MTEPDNPPERNLLAAPGFESGDGFGADFAVAAGTLTLQLTPQRAGKGRSPHADLPGGGSRRTVTPRSTYILRSHPGSKANGPFAAVIDSDERAERRARAKRARAARKANR